MEFTIRGKTYDLTKELIERHMQDRPPERIVRGRHVGAVRINDKYYPVKQVLAEALSLSQLDFNHDTARHILRRLGFDLYDNI